MARDYKHRAQNNNRNSGHQYGKQHPKKNAKVGALKWMLITGLVIAFAVFLAYLYSIRIQKPLPVAHLSKTAAIDLAKMEAEAKQAEKAKQKAEQEVKQEPPAPQFDFYTILPKKEVVVADYEIKIRSREERVGKVKEAHYVIQVGSFKSMVEAEQLRGKLALMGIESKINKAKVGDVIWHRVKIGPYARLVSVNTLMERLQQNGMRPVVTEIEN